MPENHPDSQLLERFMRGEAGAEERRSIVRHLLAGCARCGAITRRLWRLGEPGPEAVAERRPEERPTAAAGRDEDRASVASALRRLALLLADTGRGEAALQALRKARRLYDQLGDRPSLARLRHLEGKILEASGSPAEAEAAFLDARRELLATGLGEAAAAVLLDLAILYTRQGRTSELLPLTRDLLPIFRTPGLRKGVATALVCFQALAESGRPPVGLLAEMSRFVGPRPEEGM
jgi:tetratricopeptide (TPR) repeat protein